MSQVVPSVDGKDPSSGRCVVGNSLGNGNPHIVAIERFRSAMYQALTPGDFKRLARKLLSMALKGNVSAAQLLLDRTLGKATQPVEVADTGPNVSDDDAKSRLRRLLEQPEARSLLLQVIHEEGS